MTDDDSRNNNREVNNDIPSDTVNGNVSPPLFRERVSLKQIIHSSHSLQLPSSPEEQAKTGRMQPNNKMNLISLIAALLACSLNFVAFQAFLIIFPFILVSSLIAVMCGHFDFKDSKRNDKKANKIAVVGLCIGYLNLSAIVILCGLGFIVGFFYGS